MGVERWIPRTSHPLLPHPTYHTYLPHPYHYPHGSLSSYLSWCRPSCKPQGWCCGGYEGWGCCAGGCWIAGSGGCWSPRMTEGNWSVGCWSSLGGLWEDCRATADHPVSVKTQQKNNHEIYIQLPKYKNTHKKIVKKWTNMTPLSIWMFNW